jgi:hypothetical protein
MTMAMANDENVAPLSANLSISDALADPKKGLSARKSKRSRDVIEENGASEDIQNEGEPCIPASKRARIGIWWRDAMSSFDAARSSVSGTAVAKVTQVGGKLRSVPTWIQSGANVAKDFVKAASSRVSAKRALIPEKTTQAEEARKKAEEEAAAKKAAEEELARMEEEAEKAKLAQEEADRKQAQIEAEAEEARKKEEDAAEEEVARIEEEAEDEVVGEVYGFCEEEAVVEGELPADEEEEEIVEGELPADEEAAMSDEQHALEQDSLEEVAADEFEMMPQLEGNGFDQQFAMEADQAWDAGFAADQAADADFIVDSDAIEVELEPTSRITANQAADVDFIVDSQGVEWIPVRDNNTGHDYYWNQRTGETSWNPPVTSANAAFGA